MQPVLAALRPIAMDAEGAILGFGEQNAGVTLADQLRAKAQDFRLDHGLRAAVLDDCCLVGHAYSPVVSQVPKFSPFHAGGEPLVQCPSCATWGKAWRRRRSACSRPGLTPAAAIAAACVTR